MPVTATDLLSYWHDRKETRICIRRRIDHDYIRAAACIFEFREKKGI